MMASVLITLPLGCSEGVAALILLPPAECTDLLPVEKMLLFAAHRCGVDMCGILCIVIQCLSRVAECCEIPAVQHSAGSCICPVIPVCAGALRLMALHGNRMPRS